MGYLTKLKELWSILTVGMLITELWGFFLLGCFALLLGCESCWINIMVIIKQEDNKTSLWIYWLRWLSFLCYYSRQEAVDLLPDWELEPIVVFASMDLGTEIKFCSPVENYNVGRSTELKSANGLSLHYLVSYIDDWDAAGDFDHSNLDYSNFADPRIMSVDDEDMPCWDAAEESLRVVVVINPTHVKARILEEVTARKQVGALYSSWNWSVPPVIAPGTQKPLVNGSSDKALVDNVLGVHLFCLEHVVEGVTILLQPKFISLLYVLEWYI